MGAQMVQDWISNTVTDVTNALAGPATRAWPAYILFAAVIYGLRLRMVRVEKLAVGTFLPSPVQWHFRHVVSPSAAALQGAVQVVSVLNVTVLSAVIAVSLGLFCGADLQIGTAAPVALFVMALLAADLGVYLAHRMLHECRALARLRAIHDELTETAPIAMSRRRAVHDLSLSLIKGLCIGAIQAGIIVLIAPDAVAAVLIGANAMWLVLSYGAVRYRRAQAWAGFGPVVEHVLISPAQHQIHRSHAAAHQHKNYGDVFAIWDWACDTLHVTRKPAVFSGWLRACAPRASAT